MINGVGTEKLHAKSETRPYLTPLTKVNLKWIKGLNIRLETLKLTEENTGRKLFDPNDFLNMTPKAQINKSKNK